MPSNVLSVDTLFSCLFPKSLVSPYFGVEILGYSRAQKEYHCYNTESHQSFTSANVSFHESIAKVAPTPSLPLLIPASSSPKHTYILIRCNRSGRVLGTRYGHPTVTLVEDILIFGSDIVRIEWAKGAGLLGTKPVDTPTDLNPDLWNEMAIIWKTRQSANQPSQFMDKPQSVQWDAALRILKYIKTSPGIWCLGVAKNKLQLLDRAQKAEYRAMAQTTIEILWLKNLLKQLGFTYNDPHLCIVILFSIRGQTILKLTVISSVRLS
ncbi:UNVERIFIED_CONTAM: hypothetical protein Scaly_2490500 [Sesamum calycinum]|uniref:Retroviral polymerase SH3-like domain-containing protein n=1 Tax=Sesamum calycinum TaxID=2727403 RepID=A0AAW2LVU4_9LAMI